MIIRLGYVAISKTLEPLTTSSTYTVTRFEQEKDYQKLSNIILSNLEALTEILKYNEKNHIHFYRITSNLIPLATYPKIKLDYIQPYLTHYEEIGEQIHRSNIRVDMHPGEFCVLNSVKKEVVENSVQILEYHYQLLKAMNIKKKIIILHIGSSTFGKKNALTRFLHNFQKLPKHLQKSIAIENDDKVFNIEDCLYLSRILKIPVVLDYHHFKCNPAPDSLSVYLKEIFHSWAPTGLPPKIHFSSPKNKHEYRSHHEWIQVEEFRKFLSMLKKEDTNVDIMLEAKGKDEALFRLIRQLKYQTNYEFIEETSFKV